MPYAARPADGTTNTAADDYTADHTFDDLPNAGQYYELHAFVEGGDALISLKYRGGEFGDEIRLRAADGPRVFRVPRLAGIRIRNAVAGESAEYQFVTTTKK